jgi:seryl-tRNA synthetase
MYTQIRDDHIKLIRQHDQASKQVATSTKMMAEATRAKEELKCQVEEMEAKHAKVEENLQQSSQGDKQEKEELLVQLSEVQADYSALQMQEATKSAEIAELRINLDVVGDELKVSFRQFLFTF